MVGIAVGVTVGSVDGTGVGTIDGKKLGAGDGSVVGRAVGLYVTRETPAAPETATLPMQPVLDKQPSRMMYVCVGMPAGTVYCTCAQTSLPEMQTAGGSSPFPVSSYITSTPVAEYTRSVVWPEHIAAGYSGLHMETVKVCSALARTPHVGVLTVSVLVCEASKTLHTKVEVGSVVGTGEGTKEGAVGLTVGRAEGEPAGFVGFAVGRALGAGVGFEVVGCRVGTDEGTGDDRTVGNGLGCGEGIAVGGGDRLTVGRGVGNSEGARVGTAEGP